MDSEFKYVAHRCLGFALPANSPQAVAQALASPADEIEVDISGTSKALYASHSPILAPWASPLYVFEAVLAEWRRSAYRKRLRLDIKSAGIERTILARLELPVELPHITFMSRRIQTLEELYQLNSELSISLSVLLTGISSYVDKALCARATAKLSEFTGQPKGLTLFSPVNKVSPSLINDLVPEVTEVAVCISSRAELPQLYEAGVRTFLSKFPLK